MTRQLAQLPSSGPPEDDDGGAITAIVESGLVRLKLHQFADDPDASSTDRAGLPAFEVERFVHADGRAEDLLARFSVGADREVQLRNCSRPPFSVVTLGWGASYLRG